MFSFPHIDPDLDTLLEKLTAQIGMGRGVNLKNNL